MYSGDYDVPMTKVLGEMRQGYRAHQAGESYEEEHPSHIKYGGPDNYLRTLTADIKAHGVQQPITVRNGNVVTEGNHRALAAMRLRLPEVPVRHIQ